MPSGLSDYYEVQILGYIFGARTYTNPTTYYVGLWTTTLSDTSTGATAGEPSGGSYARVAVTNNSTNFAVPTSGTGQTSNSNLIAFPMATASWGTITYVALCDASTGGNIIAWASLTTPVTVSQYDTVLFQPGNLTISID